MGMFDQIEFNYPLPYNGSVIPAEKAKALNCQTKDFDCDLDDYTVTPEGGLVHHKRHYEEVPEQERPYWGDPRWETSGFIRAAGCLRSVPDGDEILPFHGYLIFIAEVEDGVYVDYRVKFTDGKLVNVEQIRE
jgi:hypothetical protein